MIRRVLYKSLNEIFELMFTWNLLELISPAERVKLCFSKHALCLHCVVNGSHVTLSIRSGCRHNIIITVVEEHQR